MPSYADVGRFLLKRNGNYKLVFQFQFIKGQQYLKKMYEINCDDYVILRDVFPYPIFFHSFEGIWVFDFPCLRWQHVEQFCSIVCKTHTFQFRLLWDFKILVCNTNRAIFQKCSDFSLSNLSKGSLRPLYRMFSLSFSTYVPPLLLKKLFWQWGKFFSDFFC